MDDAEHPREGRRHEAWVSLKDACLGHNITKLTSGALSFVSRANPRANDKHVILGVVGWKPKDFARQMNLSLSNGWGVVRTIADMVLQQGGDKFIIVKDPNKPILRLYEVPAGSLDEDDEEGGEA